MAARTPDIRIESWNELQERLYEGSWQPSLSRFRSNQAFRGASAAHHALNSGLSRLTTTAREVERHVLRNFRKYAKASAEPGESVWAWLALGQHHGLPTRLVDWTYSPFVAMHFATQDAAHAHEDGVVWCVDFVEANKDLPAVLRRLLKEEGSNVFTVELLARAAPTLVAFDRLFRRESLLFFEPPSLDDRIVNQYALFSLPSEPALPLDGWLATRPKLARRMVIPARLKPEIRDKLDQANITERVLFPGLDGLSRWLSRHYASPLGALETARVADASDFDPRPERTARPPPSRRPQRH